MGVLRTAAAVGLLLVCSGKATLAGSGPDPRTSTVPKGFTLVGSRGGLPDVLGTFTIVARNLSGNPLKGASIVVDLSGCTDLEICGDQLDANATVSCAAKTVRKFTDANGAVTFIILGHSNGSGNATTQLAGARIYGNGTLFGAPTVAALDLDGVNGVGINDLSVWLSDFGAPGSPPFGRSDFDGSGTIDVNDLSLWITAYGAGGSVQGCTTSCP